MTAARVGLRLAVRAHGRAYGLRPAPDLPAALAAGPGGQAQSAVGYAGTVVWIQITTRLFGVGDSWK